MASVLAVVLAVSGLSAFSATASAANLTSGDYTYSVNSDGTVCIEKYNGYQSSVRIPSTIDGKSVTKLAYHSFANNKNVINITLPNTITSAGEEVFLNSSLQSATLEYGTKAVPSGMFMYAQNLSKVTLPSTLKKIEAQAFDTCSSLASISIPSSVKVIGYRAFANCSAMNPITIPKSITNIESGAFRNLQISAVTFEDGTTAIPNDAMLNMSKLTSVTIPDTVQTIKYKAFCFALNKIWE